MSADEYSPKKLFTPAEANRMLPLVRRITEDIRSTYRQLVDKHERYQELAPRGEDAAPLDQSDTLADLRESMERDHEVILGFAKELDDLGVVLKGEADGLVDFPCLRDGRVVFLCWKLGEPGIEYWHEIEAGFRGRQPLEGAGAGELAAHSGPTAQPGN